jgi:hypothetical protein
MRRKREEGDKNWESTKENLKHRCQPKDLPI